MQEWTSEAGQNNEEVEDLFTNSILDMHELHNIVKNMRSNAAPRPDGLNAAFYKLAQPWIGKDVSMVITSFFQTASMMPEINNTHIALIPGQGSDHS